MLCMYTLTSQPKKICVLAIKIEYIEHQHHIYEFTNIYVYENRESQSEARQVCGAKNISVMSGGETGCSFCEAVKAWCRAARLPLKYKPL